MEAVEAVLREARRMARGLPAEKRAAIEAICSEIDQLARELAELQARGEVRTEAILWELKLAVVSDWIGQLGLL